MWMNKNDENKLARRIYMYWNIYLAAILKYYRKIILLYLSIFMLILIKY